MSTEPEIPNEWSADEKWAWLRIRAGRVADFHERDEEEELESKDSGGSDSEEDHGQLPPAFLYLPPIVGGLQLPQGINPSLSTSASALSTLFSFLARWRQVAV